MEVLQQINDFVDKIDVSKSPNPRSISSGAAKSTYYFPIICSKTVDPSTAYMISENLESSYTSFVKACFSMIPAMSVKGNVVNIEDYLNCDGVVSEDDRKNCLTYRQCNNYKLSSNCSLTTELNDDCNKYNTDSNYAKFRK